MPRFRERARCAEVDPELFYPEKGHSAAPAKRICNGDRNHPRVRRKPNVLCGHSPITKPACGRDSPSWNASASPGTGPSAAAPRATSSTPSAARPRATCAGRPTPAASGTTGKSAGGSRERPGAVPRRADSPPGGRTRREAVSRPSPHPPPARRRGARRPPAHAPKTRPDLGTCGDCAHRVVIGYHNRSWPKCDLAEITHGAGSDCRAWWPACDRFEPGDRISPDAARWTPKRSEVER
jgi:hypothetical protein